MHTNDGRCRAVLRAGVGAVTEVPMSAYHRGTR
jgi:hypothetical protein